MTEVTKEFIQKNEDEKIIEIEIERLRSFKNHPFQVKDDNEMHLLKESIEKYGILTPLIVRPVPDLEGKKKGSHTLRHSLASRLLEHEIPLPVISEILGHTTTETTMTYLRIDIAELRKCALEVAI